MSQNLSLNEQTLKCLIALDKLFSSKKHWVKYHWHVDKNGITTTDYDAVAWCLAGGMNKVCREIEGPRTDLNLNLCVLTQSALLAAIKEKFGMNLITISNDRRYRKFADIKLVIKEAKKNVREKIRKEKEDNGYLL